ncbi:MAG: ASKHA domain-containing protein [Anaerovoracaceae bacterium]
MKITFMPQNITATANKGETILEAAIRAGVNIDGNCAGVGTCGKCKVKVVAGQLTEAADHHHKLTQGEIDNGYRLACCHMVTDGMVIEMPESETTAARKKKMIKLPMGFEHNSLFRKVFVTVETSTLRNQQSDEARIRLALGDKDIFFAPEVLFDLPTILKDNNEVTVTIEDDKIIHVEKGDTTKELYGIAIDIGTTTVVAMLWNLATKEMTSVSAVTNPQGAFGADVISRITYVMEDKANLANIHKVIIDCINQAIAEFKSEIGIKSENIYDFVVVGNTTMSHIFLGVSPEQLAVSPFAPVFTHGVDIEAQKLGIDVSPTANVHLMANIAGHVGSDITAGIITTDLMKKDKGHLFIDIGTNGEIVLTGNGRAVTCSTAAGPAFEGSSIVQGMRAARGAVERVEINEKSVTIKTIGDVTPIGICGSGIIDAVGELIRTGIVDKSGRLLGKEKLRKKGISEELLQHIIETESGNNFALFYNDGKEEDIVITQKDVREVQLAKAAISAGIAIMMKDIGITTDTLERISIAGAFGNYISNDSAINIGLLPNISDENIYSLGNSAGIGASMALLSVDSRNEAEKVAREIEHIELATRPEFQDQYLLAMRF